MCPWVWIFPLRAHSNSLFPDVSNGFELDGKRLRQTGMNRIGNMVVPNDNYCKFEEWIMPILDKMVDEQVPAHRAAAALIPARRHRLLPSGTDSDGV
jgi:deoxyhypusine synthase